jgi:hypothetical protein
MRRLVEFPSESGEPILVEVEGVGLSGETRRGLSASTVVERAQTSFEDVLEKARPMASLEDRARASATFPDREVARSAIFEYLEGFYNRRRLH